MPRGRTTITALAALLALAGTTLAEDPEPGLHATWDRLTRAHVSASGWVSYAGFQRDEGVLDGYLAKLDAADPGAMSQAQQLAFWINAYNAFTVKLILKKYPDIQSIRDFWRPWKGYRWKVAGQELTLDHIEHQILRKDFVEPRIHFAINCASKSCPDLLNAAFTAADLEAQLAAVTTRFLADETKGLRVGSAEGLVWGVNHNVHLSKIFSWFGADFTRGGTTLVDWVKPRAPPAARRYMDQHAGELAVKFMAYDWSLNGE